jgi:hypothetical protein
MSGEDYPTFNCHWIILYQYIFISWKQLGVSFTRDNPVNIVSIPVRLYFLSNISVNSGWLQSTRGTCQQCETSYIKHLSDPPDDLVLDHIASRALVELNDDPHVFVVNYTEVYVDSTSLHFMLYVDDGGIFGTPEDIRNVLQALSKVFKVKIWVNWNILWDAILSLVRIKFINQSWSSIWKTA